MEAHHFDALTMSAAESDPRVDKHESIKQLMTTSSKGECHCLGEEMFEIDPLRNKPAPESYLRVVTKAAAMVAFSPIVLFGTTLFSACMLIGPQWIQNRILSIMIPRIMKRQAERFKQERDTLLAGIKEGQRVLDVGCGGGAYLRHYSKASQVVALEPVKDMHDEIQRVAQQVGIQIKRLTILPCTIEEFVNMKQFEARNTIRFDWIILGNVLCEVPDPLSTLENVKSLCKSGGHVYFSEHEGAPSGTWARRIENFMNPWWVTVSGGCNCNRDTLQMIKSVLTPDEWQVAVWLYPHFTVAMGPSFLALTLKK